MQKDHTAFDIRASASTSSTATTKPVRRDPARRGKRWNKDEEAEMITLVMNGNTSQKIADWFQRTPHAIRIRTFKVLPEFLNDSIATHDAKNKELTEQLASTRVLLDYLLRENIAKSAPMIGNSA